MGLDMYLKGRKYLNTYDEKNRSQVESVQQNFPELANFRGGDPVIKEVEIEAGYWRKANHIHDWFVRNVQNNQDDCNSYPVSRGQLVELQQICERVLGFRHLANELLPRKSGFFFGNIQYDDDYFWDIENTIDICQEVLSLPQEWRFEYQSSW
jgi:hypothetical protein